MSGPTICEEDRKIFNPAINTSNNRLSTADDYSFDNAGNTTGDSQGRSFVYDGENKQVKVRDVYNVTVGEYFYDGDGRRVKKIVPDTNEVTIFVYDAGGKLVAEYSTAVESVEDAKVAYLTADHLGSPRINTNRDGKVTARHDYHPYGEEVITAQRTSHAEYTPDSVRKQFTGQERDDETNLDYFKARYLSASLGRFTSPDPITITPYRMVAPQALSGYAYVANNPLKFTDPTGKEIKFKNQADAEAGLKLFQKGLSKDEQGYVSVAKNKDGTYSLKVDEKAGKAADSDGLLGRLYKASAASQVAVISIGKKDMTFSMTVFSANGKSTTTTTSLRKMEDADNKVSNVAGLTLFPVESRDKANPKNMAPTAYSATKNETQIIIATDETKYTPTQAIYAETLAKYGEFVRTGNVSASTHASTTVNTIEDDAVERSGENEQANIPKPAPNTKKPK